MPIRMRCRCGKEMITQDQHIGKKVRCPGCAKLLFVPNPHVEEVAEMPLSAYVESAPLDIPDEASFKDDPDAVHSSRLETRAAEAEIRSDGRVDQPSPPAPVPDSPLPRLEIPDEPALMEPEVLDDDELFDEADDSDDEEIVETEVAEAVTAQPPPLPGAGVPPPLPTENEPKKADDDVWVGQHGVSVGEATGSTRKRATAKPGELVKTERMMRVHWGLGLLLAMTFAWMAVMILNVFFSVVGGFSTRTPAAGRGLMIVLTLIRVGGWQITSGLGLAGCLMCCWSTPKSNVKTLALMSCAFLGAGMVFNFFALIIILVSSAMGAALFGLICEFLASVLGLVGVIIMLTFLRRLAKYLGDQGSVQEAHYLITAWPLVYYFIPILIICFGLVLARVSPCIMFIFFFVAFIAWLAHWVKVLLRLLNLIGTLRQIIEYRYQ